MFPKVPILGLTATAGKPIIKDVIEILTIPKTIILMEPFDRPNLFYRVRNIFIINALIYSSIVITIYNQYKYIIIFIFIIRSN